MQIFTIRSGSKCDYSIHGNNLIEAIGKDFSSIVRNANIGVHSGYELVQVVLQYNHDIPNGPGRAELTIYWKDMPSALGSASEQTQTAVVGIQANEDAIPLSMRPFYFPIDQKNILTELSLRKYWLLRLGETTFKTA